MEQASLKYIYLHGTAARVLTSGPSPETTNRVLTYGLLHGPLKHHYLKQYRVLEDKNEIHYRKQAIIGVPSPEGRSKSLDEDDIELIVLIA